MTLCIGIERRGRVWIGADSGEATEDMMRTARAPKVWRQDGWVIAGAGEWRVISLIRLAVRLPKPPRTPEQAEKTIAIDVAAALRTAYAAHEIALGAPDGPAEKRGAASDLLMGARGAGLWMVDADYHTFTDSEISIGAADHFALGWLDGSSIESPQLRIRECMRAAVRRMPGVVRLPVTILEAS